MALPVSINQLLTSNSVEWERKEFKAGWNSEDVIHSICAFANDINNWGGGYIFIGVEEQNGMPVLPPKGIPRSSLDTIQKDVLKICHLCQPYIQVVQFPTDFQGQPILALWVPGGSERPYKAPKNLGEKSEKIKHYYVRRGSSSVIASPQEESSLLSLAAKIPYDDRINHNSEISDLNLGIIREYLHEVGSALYDESNHIPFEQLCTQMQITGGTSEYLKPKNIGLLFFTENPYKFIPCARIEIVHFKDEVGDKFTEHTFDGPLHKQVQGALAYLREQVVTEQVLKVPRKEQALRFYNYPYEALEEIVCNAAYHKSYDVANPIEIRVNPQSIEVLSFEGPMPPITDNVLREERIVNRFYRNRRIGDFFKELHLTEGRSTGFPKIYAAIRRNQSPLPEFKTDDNQTYFLATVPIHRSFIEPDDKGRMIMNFCSTPKSSHEILEFLGLSYHSYNLKKFIQPLVDTYCLIPTSESTKDTGRKYISREAAKI